MSEAVVTLRNDDVSWTRTDEATVVVLDLRNSTYLRLNQSGALLWTALAGGATLTDLSDLLVSNFGLDGPAAYADVDAFLGMLRERDLTVSSARQRVETGLA